MKIKQTQKERGCKKRWYEFLGYTKENQAKGFCKQIKKTNGT